MPPLPWSSNFLGWLPPSAPTKKNPLPDFSFFHILCYSLLHVIVLGMKTIFTFRTEYRELFIRKLKSKEREVNFGSPSHSSPGACGIWHVLHLNRRLMQEWHHLSHLILTIVYFIRFTAFSTCPVVILCKCPGISHCWLASSERTRLLQAMSFNYLYLLTLAALQMLL